MGQEEAGTEEGKGRNSTKTSQAKRSQAIVTSPEEGGEVAGDEDEQEEDTEDGDEEAIVLQARGTKRTKKGNTMKMMVVTATEEAA